jgi:nucleoside-diphosphate-sugar epimerase
MNVLVTGGAGFIGSSLAEALVADGHRVRVLDDLSSGFADNVPAEAEVVTGSVTDQCLVRDAVRGVEVVFHHAASRSVLASVESPLRTDFTNTHGTLSVLKASCDAGVRRVVYASSSSVYGGAAPLPASEAAAAVPRSPYAVSKLAGEHYARVFAEVYGLETVSLRYFNVFGPRQRPDSPYAAVIPLFIDALRQQRDPVVHGDGQQSRDFTYIDDVVTANLAAAVTPPEVCSGRVYNLAGGQAHSLLEVLAILGRILGVQPTPVFAEPRQGDVRHSQADISAARRDLGFVPHVAFEEGLTQTVSWFVRR